MVAGQFSVHENRKETEAADQQQPALEYADKNIHEMKRKSDFSPEG